MVCVRSHKSLLNLVSLCSPPNPEVGPELSPKLAGPASCKEAEGEGSRKQKVRGSRRFEEAEGSLITVM